MYDTTKLKNENIFKTFSIAVKNRYQVLEDEGLAAEEESEEIERDSQVMGRHTLQLQKEFQVDYEKEETMDQ